MFSDKRKILTRLRVLQGLSKESFKDLSLEEQIRVVSVFVMLHLESDFEQRAG